MGKETAPVCMRKLLELIRVHRFVLSKSCSVDGSEKEIYSYGTPGTLLRQNIIREWWKYMVSLQENTFPVEPSPLSTVAGPTELSGEKHGSHPVMRKSLSKDILDNYHHNLDLVNRRLPFSQVAVGVCYNDEKEVKEHEHKLLQRGVCGTHMVHQHYAAPGNIAQTFDHWLSYRLRWWRQFARKPSKFVTNNSDTTDGKTKSSIDYEFPWGQESVETVCNHGDQDIQELEDKTGLNFQGKSSRKLVYPVLIECQTSLESAMTAFLVDAFLEKSLYNTGKENKQNASRQVLQLHTHIAPFTVSMITTGSKTRELRLVANQWTAELREGGIQVLDITDTSLTQDAQFSRSDELGVPYTVVLNDQTLETGVLSIRHRDTMLREQVHITRFKNRLLRYTNPI